MTNAKCQIHLAAPRAFGLKNSKKSGKERNMQGKYQQTLWGVLRVLFLRVPPSPLSNYNQIKDRVFVTRHHWRV